MENCVHKYEIVCRKIWCKLIEQWNLIQQMNWDIFWETPRNVKGKNGSSNKTKKKN